MAIIGNKRTTNFEVIDEILRVEGIFEKVFGKLLNYLVFDENIDNCINVLKNIYGYEDTEHLFSRKIDKKDFRDLAKIIFKFQENMNTRDTE